MINNYYNILNKIKKKRKKKKKNILINYKFKNRINQEPPEIIKALKSTYINMNETQKNDEDTPDGFFMITIQPNCNVDEITLEKTFKSILSHYYRWKYGTKWIKLKNVQQEFRGVIEQQVGLHNHIHFIIYQYDIVELSIFLGYIRSQFKKFFNKTSFNFQRVYSLYNAINYCSQESFKDQSWKYRSITMPISSNLFKH